MVYILGLMSGTSVDGIDAALVDLRGTAEDLSLDLIKHETYPYEPALKNRILSACQGDPLSLEELADLDDQIAAAFANAALGIQGPEPVATLIGSHGQTVFHRPAHNQLLGYSLQLGRGDAIAQRTQIPTVSNFRVADIAAGGQGAPLVPKIDLCLLSDPDQSRCIQNLGGMGNTTFLPARSSTQSLGQGVIGWDTGPGNVLIDLAVTQFTEGAQTFDQDGQWASQGEPCQSLLQEWLRDSFFEQPPPKSTGREYFGVEFFQKCLEASQQYQLSHADILATLTEFTVQSIIQEYNRYLEEPPAQVLLCGGGSKNGYLRARLQSALGSIPVMTTDDFGVSAECKEAIAFAVLAHWHCQGIAGNLPAVTGAKQDCILGVMYPVPGRSAGKITS